MIYLPLFHIKMLFASCSFRYSNHYLPVRDLDHPPALLRDLRIVGDYDDRPALLVQRLEQLHLSRQRYCCPRQHPCAHSLRTLSFIIRYSFAFSFCSSFMVKTLASSVISPEIASTFILAELNAPNFVFQSNTHVGRKSLNSI